MSGSGAVLFPAGVSSVQDIPWDLACAIEHGTRICAWQENILSDDMPPEWMWPFDDILEEWFAEVDRKRNRDNGDDESSEMVGNELTERFKRN